MLHHLKSTASRLWKDERGASLLEYSVLVGLIIAVSGAAVIAVGGWAGNQWTALKSALNIP
jgi:pilus assembly protein Flp/PilA